LNTASKTFLMIYIYSDIVIGKNRLS